MQEMVRKTDNKRTFDRSVNTLTTVDMDDLKMPVIAVYGPNQIEYTGKYVARIFDADRPTNTVIIRDSLEELQEHIKHNMPPMFTGTFLGRGADDDPSLIGCWI